MSNMHPASTFLSSFGVVIGIYFVIAIGVLFAVQPLRQRMLVLAESLLAEEEWSKKDRARINIILDSCWSFRMGLLMPVAIVITILQEIVGEVPESPSKLMKDERYAELCGRFFLSVLAANPLVAPITIALAALGLAVHLCSMLVEAVRTHSNKIVFQRVSEYVEKPLYTALNGMKAAKVV